jgi:hypothetical protein
MNVMNRRNALLGWAVWTVAKGVAKRKAKSVAPSSNGGRNWQTKAAIGAATGVAVAGGAAVIWRLKSSGNGAEPAV